MSYAGFKGCEPGCVVICCDYSLSPRGYSVVCCGYGSTESIRQRHGEPALWNSLYKLYYNILPPVEVLGALLKGPYTSRRRSLLATKALLERLLNEGFSGCRGRKLTS